MKHIELINREGRIMGVSFIDVNYNVLLEDIEQNCLTEDVCGLCKKKNCLIGYTKACINDSLKTKMTFVENGVNNIPHDLRSFEKRAALEAVAHILRQCKSCEEDHFEDCMVNVIRSCYEVIAFGEPQEYQGSIFMYLSAIQNDFPEEAAHILEVFQSYKG